MARNLIPTIVAILSTFVHCSAAILLIIALVSLRRLVHQPSLPFDDSYNSVNYISSHMKLIWTISFILEVALLAVSILLIVGVRKKSHQHIAPWVYLTGVYLVLNVLDLLSFGKGVYGSLMVANLLSTILHTVMWYAIFKYWQELRKGPSLDLPPNSPPNYTYATPAPGSIYAADSGNNYLPPNVGPQMQTGASGYPPQYYAGGHIQSAINPQFVSASYVPDMPPPYEEKDQVPAYK